VGIQAVLNMVHGERYKTIPDEVIQYAAGLYGAPVGPIAPAVLDRIMSAPRAKQILASAPAQPTIEELRAEYGTNDDDELILRALVPPLELAKMREAGPIARNFPLLSSTELDEVRQLMTLSNLPVIELRSPGFSARLQRPGSGSAG
jgi:oxaloacetate decarboxylase alpha subunit